MSYKNFDNNSIIRQAIFFISIMLHKIPFALRITIIFVMVTALPMATFGYFNLTYDIEKIRLDHQATLQNDANGLALQFQVVLRQYEILTQAIAADADIVNYLKNHTATNNLATAQALHDLKKLHQSIPHARQISIVSDESIIQLSSLGLSEMVQATNSLELKKKLSTHTKTLLLNQQSLYFTAPILSNKQTYLGMMLVEIDPIAIFQLLQQEAVNHPDYTVQLQQTNGVNHVTIVAMNPLSTKNHNTQSINSSIQAQAIIGESDLKIVLNKSNDLVMQPIKQLLLSNGLISLLCLLSSITATWFFSHRWSKPIQLLINKSKQVQQGNYSTPELDESLYLHALHHDEMGRFIAVYNQMVSDIHQRSDILESMVSERTAELSLSNKLLEQNQKRINQELELAHNMQQALLPQQFVNTHQFDVFAAMQPAQEMGGDFYDSFELENGHHVFLVADVAGKGIASAFFMAISSTLIKQAAAKYVEEPHRVLNQTNEWLCQRNPQNLFVTVFYAIFDPINLVLKFANAGHPSALWLTHQNHIQMLDSQPQLPLGAWEGVNYISHSVTLQPHDCIVLYTDGITEALSANQQEYGEQRLHNLLNIAKKHLRAKAIFQALENDISLFVDSAEAHDDMTVLVLKINAKPQICLQQRYWKIEPNLAALDAVNLTIHNYLNLIIANQIHTIYAIQICLEEILSNIIRHAKIPTESMISITILIYPNSVTCHIQDNSFPFNPFTVRPKTDLTENIIDQELGGMGLPLLLQLADEWDYYSQNGNNNTVFIKYFQPI